MNRKLDFKTKSGKTVWRVALKEFWYGNYYCCTINWKGKKLDIELFGILED